MKSDLESHLQPLTDQDLEDIERTKAMGRSVIDLIWQACHTYNVEAFQVNEMIQKNFGFPTLHLETDFSESDTEQLRVRIEAYLEML